MEGSQRGVVVGQVLKSCVGGALGGNGWGRLHVDGRYVLGVGVKPLEITTYVFAR